MERAMKTTPMTRKSIRFLANTMFALSIAAGFAGARLVAQTGAASELSFEMDARQWPWMISVRGKPSSA